MRTSRTLIAGSVTLCFILTGCAEADRPEPAVSTPTPTASPGGRPTGASPASANGARPATDAELEQELTRAVRELELARTQNTELRTKLDKLTAANAQLVASIERDASQPLTRPPASAGRNLPSDVDTALRQFAEKAAGRVWYDSQRAAVSFANDRLFASGADTIGGDARALLSEFAGIAARTSPNDFELIVVGHTDNTPVAGGARGGRATNWHLSVDRAIAVKDVLVAAGIPESRVGVMGYSYFRPLGGDKALDRRVEVFFAPKGDMQARAPVRP